MNEASRPSHWRQRGSLGNTKKLPLHMREAVAKRVNDFVAERNLNMREAESIIGIDVASLSKIRNAEGCVGVHALLRLRAFFKVSIDELLGLPPLEDS